MSVKRKRTLPRSLQSSRDRRQALKTTSVQFNDPLAEYRAFLASLRHRRFTDTDFTLIPSSLLEFSAVCITSLLPHLTSSHQTVPFLVHLLRRAKISCTSFIVALLYLHRIHSLAAPSLTATPSTFAPQTPEEAFLAALVLADKSLSDIVYDNSQWIRFTLTRKITLERLNALERHFLQRLNYALAVTEEEYESFLWKLEYAMVRRRVGWITWEWTFSDIGWMTAEGGVRVVMGLLGKVVMGVLCVWCAAAVLNVNVGYGGNEGIMVVDNGGNGVLSVGKGWEMTMVTSATLKKREEEMPWGMKDVTRMRQNRGMMTAKSEQQDDGFNGHKAYTEKLLVAAGGEKNGGLPIEKVRFDGRQGEEEWMPKKEEVAVAA